LCLTYQIPCFRCRFDLHVPWTRPTSGASLTALVALACGCALFGLPPVLAVLGLVLICWNTVVVRSVRVRLSPVMPFCCAAPPPQSPLRWWLCAVSVCHVRVPRLCATSVCHVCAPRVACHLCVCVCRVVLWSRSHVASIPVLTFRSLVPTTPTTARLLRGWIETRRTTNCPHDLGGSVCCSYVVLCCVARVRACVRE